MVQGNVRKAITKIQDQNGRQIDIIRRAGVRLGYRRGVDLGTPPVFLLVAVIVRVGENQP